MKVLAIEKDPNLLSLIGTRLRSRQYEVIEATEAVDALRKLEQGGFDIVLLSTDMERIGGKLLVEKIREQPFLSTLPIIMMTREDQVSELLLSHERGFDDFLIKPFNPLALQLRVAMNISRVQVRSQANALTQLPGNIAIETLIRNKIEEEETFSVLYIDINHFKSFNDRYGFVKGDDAIRQTARLLIQTKNEICGEQECFVGHIGGDDFIIILDSEKEEPFARHFISEFDRIMPTYYSDQDQEQGFISVTNRQGNIEKFPLMSCSVAACTNMYRPYRSLGEISRDASQVKSFLKSQSGSHYLRDRRSSPITEMEQAADVYRDVKEENDEEKSSVMEPLGKVLLNAGLINEEQLDLAMQQHMKTGQRLGQTLIQMNLVRSEDVGQMLEKKLNISYVSLKQTQPPRDLLRLFTVDFIKTKRVVPFEMTETELKLAMCDPFDLKTLDAIEQMSHLKPVPYLALEDEFAEFMEEVLEGNTHEEGEEL